MCAMHMLCKTGRVCLGVVDPHFVFDHICVLTIRIHMCCLIPEDLSLELKQVSSLCTIPLIPTNISGGDM